METKNYALTNKLKYFLMAKEEGDSQIVITLVLIVIALVLAFLFKDQITTFMTNAITTMSTKMNALLSGLS